MRIKITCDVGHGIVLPINYNSQLTGVIYKFLGQSDAEYADFLHDDGYQVDDRRYKLFTFSQLMARERQILQDKILFSSELTWQVSSSREVFLENLANTLVKNGVVQIGNQTLKVKDVEMVSMPPVFGGDEFPLFVTLNYLHPPGT